MDRKQLERMDKVVEEKRAQDEARAASEPKDDRSEREENGKPRPDAPKQRKK
jgi:hypothetical protein